MPQKYSGVTKEINKRKLTENGLEFSISDIHLYGKKKNFM